MLSCNWFWKIVVEFFTMLVVDTGLNISNQLITTYVNLQLQGTIVIALIFASFLIDSRHREVCLRYPYVDVKRYGIVINYYCC